MSWPHQFGGGQVQQGTAAPVGGMSGLFPQQQQQQQQRMMQQQMQGAGGVDDQYMDLFKMMQMQAAQLQLMQQELERRKVAPAASHVSSSHGAFPQAPGFPSHDMYGHPMAAQSSPAPAPPPPPVAAAVSSYMKESTPVTVTTNMGRPVEGDSAAPSASTTSFHVPSVASATSNIASSSFVAPPPPSPASASSAVRGAGRSSSMSRSSSFTLATSMDGDVPSSSSTVVGEYTAALPTRADMWKMEKDGLFWCKINEYSPDLADGKSKKTEQWRLNNRAPDFSIARVGGNRHDLRFQRDECGRVFVTNNGMETLYLLPGGLDRSAGVLLLPQDKTLLRRRDALQTSACLVESCPAHGSWRCPELQHTVHLHFYWKSHPWTSDQHPSSASASSATSSLAAAAAAKPTKPLPTSSAFGDDDDDSITRGGEDDAAASPAASRAASPVAASRKEGRCGEDSSGDGSGDSGSEAGEGEKRSSGFGSDHDDLLSRNDAVDRQHHRHESRHDDLHDSRHGDGVGREADAKRRKEGEKEEGEKQRDRAKEEDRRMEKEWRKEEERKRRRAADRRSLTPVLDEEELYQMDMEEKGGKPKRTRRPPGSPCPSAAILYRGSFLSGLDCTQHLAGRKHPDAVKYRMRGEAQRVQEEEKAFQEDVAASVGRKRPASSSPLGREGAAASSRRWASAAAAALEDGGRGGNVSDGPPPRKRQKTKGKGKSKSKSKSVAVKQEAAAGGRQQQVGGGGGGRQQQVGGGEGGEEKAGKKGKQQRGGGGDGMTSFSASCRASREHDRELEKRRERVSLHLGRSEPPEDTPVRCILQCTYGNRCRDASLPYILCDGCFCWHHSSCVNVCLDDLEEDQKWYCLYCEEIGLHK